MEGRRGKMEVREGEIEGGRNVHHRFKEFQERTEGEGQDGGSKEVEMFITALRRFNRGRKRTGWREEEGIWK
ncbi:hypothetical protein CBR_g80055 [Chara braunii]|uniref:Uncharacterized protein n=1 Tax=Chara braunii TaxID=69332 RepID=A0A388JL51_CHABU|nr:hypothetical protein CBR_g80055 [Chara braunii]|eukprot:GBG46608.1 hypothetical protein CBR_g80055 [Chara braunii]